jgi:hypothetical protein
VYDSNVTFSQEIAVLNNTQTVVPLTQGLSGAKRTCVVLISGNPCFEFNVLRTFAGSSSRRVFGMRYVLSDKSIRSVTNGLGSKLGSYVTTTEYDAHPVGRISGRPSEQ